jgi:hypothetical protein
VIDLDGNGKANCRACKLLMIAMGNEEPIFIHP